ncbi:MAG: protoporphyrinogen oxidase HemJ [Proteobacteria bacterium]|nr:protoporphyrinogen oxidase HemJ [Pseudomonadota bacterium]
MNIETTYHLLKALHLISMVAWMAGMLYLPRLFVYHCRVAPGSEASELFKVMERRLMRVIINPAMIATWVFGLWIALLLDLFNNDNGWLHAKLGCVLMLSGMHGMFSRYRKDFARDANRKSEKFFRIINEVPAVLLVIIVFLVVFKPF